MRFADPDWLWIGAASASLLFVLLVRAERLKARALTLLAHTRLRAKGTALPSAFRRWLRVAVTVFAVAMGFVALARPQKGMHWETMTRKGTDLLLLVDTSRSMDADDVKPTRLERVKLAIRDLVDRFPGDRIGLVAFAGDAFVQSPLTLDHDALLETVNALDTSVVARGGTNIGRAIDVSTSALASEPAHQKQIVLLSDGEDLEGSGLKEAEKAGAAGIVIDAVGVGSREGELVPARDERGRVAGVVRDEHGVPVRSRIDEPGLTAIASAAHGTYRPLGTDGQGLDRLYREALAERAHVDASSRTHRVYSERFQIPLALALVALLFDSLLSLRFRRGPRRGRGSRPAIAAGVATLLLLMPALAQASVSEATRAYAAGRFDEAAKAYEAESAEHPKDARLAFNAGDAAYRARRYDAADSLFKRAASTADPALQEHVLYNRGDVLYRSGEEHQSDARDLTIQRWKAAIGAYEGAMALNPKDADARFNRDFVKRKLAELEQKQKDDPKKGDEGKQNDEKSKGAQGKDGKGQKGKDEKGTSAGKDDGKPKPKVGASPAPARTKPGGQSEPKEQSAHADSKTGAAPAPGELSPRDARALLGALRGEERHRVERAPDGGKAVQDAPGKDW